MIPQPRFHTVNCLSPVGIHAMAYAEWGDPAAARTVVCVHGLSRTGRDFDRLARALSDRYRVVCPDVVGRGRSGWLRDPAYYAVPQYVADMVTLIARLDVAAVDWLGTSMGGLIGLSLAGQPGAPIARLVINDVGPTLDPAALMRIGQYIGAPMRFTDFEQAVDYIAAVSVGFGLQSRDEWREATTHVVKRDGDHWILHYDPRIGAAFRALTPELAAAGEAALWRLYDQIICPTLVLRGAQSDLLSHVTAQQMAERGPHAQVREIDGVGHAPMFFDAAQIAMVRTFLDAGAA